MGGMAIFEHWLVKAENGVEPSLTLKLKLFQIINELKVQEHHLADSLSLQTIIQKNQKSLLRQIRELSESIILKWGKVAYNDVD